MSNVISIIDRIKKKINKKKKLSAEEQLYTWVKLIEGKQLKSFFVVARLDDDQCIYNCYSADIFGAIELAKHDFLTKDSHRNPSKVIE